MDKLEEKIGYAFRDRELLRTALTHSSYANERHGDDVQSYERLEFLGDSILGLVTAEFLYAHEPRLPEGSMTRLRAELVCEASARTCGRALVFSLHDGDPLVDTARHMAAWRYESEFMIVTYGADPNGFTGVPYIEAGAL